MIVCSAAKRVPFGGQAACGMKQGGPHCQRPGLQAWPADQQCSARLCRTRDNLADSDFAAGFIGLTVLLTANAGPLGRVALSSWPRAASFPQRRSEPDHGPRQARFYPALAGPNWR